MRGPIVAGVFAGLLVALVGLSVFVLLAVSRPDPSIATPTPTFVAGSPQASGPSEAPASATPNGGPDGTDDRPSASPTPSVPIGLDIGDRAPELRLLAVGGSEVDTSLIEDRPIWINFMATWCPPCIDELPLLQRAQAQLGEDMTIILVDVAEPEEVVSEFVGSLGVDLPVGLDEDGAAQRTWGAYALPVHYWIDADGRIGSYLWGGAGPEQFLEGVRSVLPEAELDL